MILVALVVIGTILVTMWPGLRKPHALKPTQVGLGRSSLFSSSQVTARIFGHS